MRSADFWEYFDKVAKPRLALRVSGFNAIFNYLDGFDRPVGIVETGCAREKDAWEGDGQSTILFDKYAQSHLDSTVVSVDKDPATTAFCRSLVSGSTHIHTADSVAFLKSLTERLPSELASIDLLYLDSMDLDPSFEDTLPSAVHHLKELLAIVPRLRAETLVVVDDSPLQFVGVLTENGSVNLVRTPRIGGKGTLIADYASAIGAETFFTGYQCGWFGFGQSSQNSFRSPRDQKQSGTAPWEQESRTGSLRLEQGSLHKMSSEAMTLNDSCGGYDEKASELVATKLDQIAARQSQLSSNSIADDLVAQGALPVSEIRAVMAWMKRHPLIAKTLNRAGHMVARGARLSGRY